MHFAEIPRNDALTLSSIVQILKDLAIHVQCIWYNGDA